MEKIVTITTDDLIRTKLLMSIKPPKTIKGIPLKYIDVAGDYERQSNNIWKLKKGECVIMEAKLQNKTYISDMDIMLTEQGNQLGIGKTDFIKGIPLKYIVGAGEYVNNDGVWERVSR